MFSIIIPNYNGRKLLKNCLESLNRFTSEECIRTPTRRNCVSCEIIVVDNNSTDGSKKMINDQWPMVKLIANDNNLGFAKAVNQGIKKARYPYLVVMNNDLKLEKDWFQIMDQVIKRWSKKEKIGAYFGQVLDWGGKKIESTGLIYHPCGKAINRDNGEIFKKNKYTEEEIIWGGNASIIIYLRSALKKIGVFDSSFFAYLEDVDLALRLNAAGFKTVFAPQALSYHRGGATADLTPGLRYRLVARNWWFIMLKHYSLSYLFRHLSEILLEQFKNFVKIGSLSGMIWAVRELILKCPKLIKKRKPLF